MPFPLFLDESIDVARMSIINAIDAPINDLSVKEICEKANVSKQTFYSRFSSKYDIPNWYAAHYEQRMLNKVGRTLSWEDGLGGLFSVYELHKPLFHNTSKRGRDVHSEIETKTRRRAAVVETLKTYRKVELTEELMFLVEAYLELEVFLAGEWFRANLSPSAERFTSYYIECIPRKFYKVMQFSSEGEEADQSESYLFAHYYKD